MTVLQLPYSNLVAALMPEHEVAAAGCCNFGNARCGVGGHGGGRPGAQALQRIHHIVLDVELLPVLLRLQQRHSMEASRGHGANL